MNRHAFLIMAHHQFDFLKELLLALDDERNDIYLHIDQKVPDSDLPDFSHAVQKSNLYLTERLNVSKTGARSAGAHLSLSFFPGELLPSGRACRYASYPASETVPCEPSEGRSCHHPKGRQLVQHHPFLCRVCLKPPGLDSKVFPALRLCGRTASSDPCRQLSFYGASL